MADVRQIDAALQAVAEQISGSPEYSDFVAHRARYRSDALQVAACYKHGTLLEVGSLPCHFTMLLKRLGYPCIGVDLAPERYAQRIAAEGLNIVRSDIEREPLPFESESFDLVVFNEVFEHLRIDPLFALSEINRVLAANGTLLLTTPNLYAIQRIVKLMLGRGFNDPLGEFMKLRRLGHMGHIREYSASEMRRFLAYSGFRVESLQFDHYYYPPGKRGFAARILFAILPRRFRSFQVLRAKKVGQGAELAPLG